MNPKNPPPLRSKVRIIPFEDLGMSSEDAAEIKKHFDEWDMSSLLDAWGKALAKGWAIFE